MKVLFHIGEPSGVWYMYKGNIVEYDNFPMDTLPQIGSQIVGNLAISSKIDEYMKLRKITGLCRCNFVRRIDVTPLGPVVILGTNPSCIEVTIVNLDNKKEIKNILKVLPRVGDTLIQTDISYPEKLFVHSIEFIGEFIKIYTSTKKPGATNSSDTLNVRVVNTVNTHTLVVNEAPLEITPAGDNAMEVWIAGQDRNKPLAVKIDNNPLY